MPIIRSSREIAQRVDLSSHKQRNRLRRLTWLTALLAGVSCAAWLTSASLRGKQEIYQPGQLSTVHQMLSNDCSKCHDKWAALGRLTTLSEDVRSVPNGKCVVCHSAAGHQIGQVPAHREIKCSSCHDEHRGDVQLSHIADHHCTNCHNDLTKHGGSNKFARHIDSFGGSSKNAHPEFAIHRKDASSTRVIIPTRVGEFSSHASPESSLETDWNAIAQNPDSARIRFNHKAHLQARYGSDGDKLRNPKAFKDGSGQFLDCNSCHQLDSAGRYMRPIQYDQHCATCHPLLFDNTNHPGVSVPHESPGIVRGFLTNRYTLDALKGATLKDGKPRSPLDPGSPYRGLLTEDLAKEVDRNVLTAEKLLTSERVLTAEKHVLRKNHTLFGREAGGSCRYCHTVTEANEDRTWGIVPPGIPNRWYPHSRFRHDSHRMLDCNSCHRDFSQSAEGTHVSSSQKTADVLMPPIGICLKCHTSQSDGGNLLSASKSFTGAHANCVECHSYHKRDGASQNGTLGLDLKPTKEDHRPNESPAR
ncbi:MAG: hypothetical protein HON53_14425 [Planctomycetaceae bacterium]|jgi:hypothetical protein|nr:hypothetical protein [Planctomycetaceae bacterium]MBT6158241.1 hypothetical protein [Planctomycetaceae bacterium]MBT6487577.1 hypothetical protein [Planctomycetaceae bacterium]MBT6493235.1 hypothetical protein [Planctomycetaceae bacterium]